MNNTLLIERLANNGCGVGTDEDGKTVFVTGAVPGDTIRAELTAEHSRYREAEIREIITSSPDRIPVDCPDAERCGGCCFRQLNYDCELRAKQSFVEDAFRRLGGLDVSCEAILPSPKCEAYRNKAEFAVETDNAGNLCAGFYSEKTHRVLPVRDCRAVPEVFLRLKDRACEVLSEYGIAAYDPRSRKGLLRHLVLRRSGLTGELMLILVITRKGFRGEREAAAKLAAEFPELRSVILNMNTASGSVVLGAENRLLYGQPTLRDRLCGVPVEIGPLSFFQVNTPAAEVLYQTAAEFAGLMGSERVLDLYCGMGTIGLSLADRCKSLIGGEIIPEAVEAAKRSAAALGLKDARFLCGDAGEIAEQLLSEGAAPDLILLDPPRKGCSPRTIEAVCRLNPSKIVMVSCDPATAARDAAALSPRGYTLRRLRPVDLFPRTRHVETVCLLSKLSNTKHHVEVELNLDEMDLTTAESKATYDEVRDYVMAQTGLHVTNLNIAQIKRKCGIIERENYNLPKTENPRQPKCTKEKEEAIKKAFIHFGMI